MFEFSWDVPSFPKYLTQHFCGVHVWFGLVWQDEDEEQGTLKFGKQKEQASYGGMDEEEKAIWKVIFSLALYWCAFLCASVCL